MLNRACGRGRLRWRSCVTTLAAICIVLGDAVADAQPRDVDGLRAAAAAFLAGLDAKQRAAASFPLDDDVRATWSNLPIMMAPPAGILLRDLNDVQRIAFHRLLRASWSSQGYAKSVAIMWLDDVLGEIETARLNRPDSRRSPQAVAMAANRHSAHYAVAFFGDPSGKDWGWKMTGHHLAINVTVAGDRIGFMPLFLGSNPRVVRAGPYAGWMALPAAGAAGLALMASLDADQAGTARLAELPRDVVEGPGRRASLKDYQGVSAETFSARQLALLQALVDEYLGHAKPPSRNALLDAIATAGWRKLWFAWSGDADPDGRFYYRVHGPRILIEYSRQNANHDHAVIRDPANDYGEHWLDHHYKEFHRTTR